MGVPVSIIFGCDETCGVCTYSVDGAEYYRKGYPAKPFRCNQLRQYDGRTLLIEGSNIAETSYMEEVDGVMMLDSGVSVVKMEEDLVIHKMPSTCLCTM